MKKQSNKLYILLLLIMVFAAPGVTAYLFYQHPGWLGATKVNKGILLEPPVAFPALKGQNRWRIVFWTPNPCDRACLKQLDTLARVRLALGRKLYQVDQWLILGDKASSVSSEVQSTLRELNFNLMRWSPSKLDTQNALFSEPKIFIADPNNYLILSYLPLVNPNDVYQDLKLLLNRTENG
jgi:hypothetical protein